MIAWLRFWREGLILLALLIAGFHYAGKLRAERALARAETRIATLSAQLRAVQRDAARRTRAARAALAQARAENARLHGRREALRRSAGTPRPPLPGCTISEALRAAEGAL